MPGSGRCVRDCDGPRRSPVMAFMRSRLRGGLALAAATCLVTGTTLAGEAPPRPDHPAAKGHQLDRSGRRQVGKASFYAPKFAGRKMADGTPMDPHEDNAASKTLPL